MSCHALGSRCLPYSRSQWQGLDQSFRIFGTLDVNNSTRHSKDPRILGLLRVHVPHGRREPGGSTCCHQVCFHVVNSYLLICSRTILQLFNVHICIFKNEFPKHDFFRDRKIDPSRKQTNRNVYRCHVIGPRDAGKSTFCQGLLGKSLEVTKVQLETKCVHLLFRYPCWEMTEEECYVKICWLLKEISNVQDIEGVRGEDLPRHTINTLQVYGQEKYLVLQVRMKLVLFGSDNRMVNTLCPRYPGTR